MGFEIIRPEGAVGRYPDMRGDPEGENLLAPIGKDGPKLPLLSDAEIVRLSRIVLNSGMPRRRREIAARRLGMEVNGNKAVLVDPVTGEPGVTVHFFI